MFLSSNVNLKKRLGLVMICKRDFDKLVNFEK